MEVNIFGADSNPFYAGKNDILEVYGSITRRYSQFFNKLFSNLDKLEKENEDRNYEISVIADSETDRKTIFMTSESHGLAIKLSRETSNRMIYYNWDYTFNYSLNSFDYYNPNHLPDRNRLWVIAEKDIYSWYFPPNPEHNIFWYLLNLALLD